MSNEEKQEKVYIYSGDGLLPLNVRRDNDLIPMARILYAEIYSLTIEKGYCYAGNEYLANILGCSESRIKAWIKNLADKDYIKVKIIDGYRRHIWVQERYYQWMKGGSETGYPPARNQATPQPENRLHNINSSKSIINKEKKAIQTSQESLKLAELLFLETRKKDPKYLLDEDAREKTLTRWAKDIEKIIRIDGRTATEVAYVIRWAKNDSFWSSNIMSGSKLREKFSNLVIKAGESKTPPTVSAAPPMRNGGKLKVYKCPVCGKVRPNGHTYTFCKNPACGAPDFVVVEE